MALRKRTGNFRHDTARLVVVDGKPYIWDEIERNQDLIEGPPSGGAMTYSPGTLHTRVVLRNGREINVNSKDNPPVVRVPRPSGWAAYFISTEVVA